MRPAPWNARSPSTSPVTTTDRGHARPMRCDNPTHLTRQTRPLSPVAAPTCPGDTGHRNAPPAVTRERAPRPDREHRLPQRQWSVLFFYPADFTFVCPTELGDWPTT